MGYFSWKTADTNRSISNRDSIRGAFTVYLLCPNGETIREDDYDGYGRFGGHDVYALLAKWNAPETITGNVEVDRLTGINMTYLGNEKLRYEIKIVEDGNLSYDDVKASEYCPEQGFFYNAWEEDEDDAWDEDEDEDEEGYEFR